VRTFRLFAFLSLVLLALGMLAGTALLYSELNAALPEIERLEAYRPPMATQILADDGTIVGELFLEKRYVVPIERIPLHVRQAFIAAEDDQFYAHQGVDPVSIGRALLNNLAGRVQGGSTITQQVVKQLLLSPRRSYERKIKEMLLATRVEQRLSKDQILFLYLNHIYLGSGAYGVAAAAQEYFGKPVEQLTVAEAALLAGLPQAPSRYSPFKNWPQARARQSYVLKRMATVGFITPAEALLALREPLLFEPRRGNFAAAPHYVEHVRRLLDERYGENALYQMGLRVHTSLNLRMQAAAETALRQGLEEIGKRQKYGNLDPTQPLQGAAVVVDPRTGDVKALVGGIDFGSSQFNRATQARRQPGSAFKPLVYAAAFDDRFTPASVIVDEPVSYPDNRKVWSPQNYDHRFYGPITLRQSLTQSRNVPTVKLAQRLGVKRLVTFLRSLGIRSPLQPNLSLALGAAEVTPLELVSAYTPFANQGMRAEPRFITSITDSNGHLIDETPPRLDPVLAPETAFLVTSVLQDVIERGTGRRALGLGRPAAGKTGTTNDMNDAWFIGYTPQLLAGFWVGFDERRALGKSETGGRAAAPIWLQFMKQALAGEPILDFQAPQGISFVPIDPHTGRRVHPGTPGAILECFRRGTEPRWVEVAGTAEAGLETPPQQEPADSPDVPGGDAGQDDSGF
jgi:penicillin-binding protein 1A